MTSTGQTVTPDDPTEPDKTTPTDTPTDPPLHELDLPHTHAEQQQILDDTDGEVGNG
jgi:hypothetical protein